MDKIHFSSTVTDREYRHRLRVKYNIPIIMLTARGDDIDKIVGLEIGADDYMAKPFNPKDTNGPVFLRVCSWGGQWDCIR